MNIVVENIARVASLHLSTGSTCEINAKTMFLQYSRETVENTKNSLNITGAEIKLPDLCKLLNINEDCSRKTFLQQVNFKK